MELIFFLLYLILIYPINHFIKKSNYLPSQTGESHQNFLGKKNIPLSGGFFIVIFITYLTHENFYLYLSFIVFYLLGISSDKKYIISPKVRFILQMMFILLFVNFFEIRIFDLRNDYLSSLLENNIISIVFVVLCFLVLINGSNFIDGLNGLQIGYYLIILIILLKNGFLNFTNINNIEVIYLIIILFYLLVLNFNEKLFLGDSGSYTLSLFTGYFLVLVYNNNQNISPFFIALLLWYPCFENLFSILRKFTFNKSPLKPDNKHLHQLIYIYLKIQFKLKKNLANNISSIMINSFNLIFISIASLHYKHTFIQFVMILLFSLIYIFLYIRILKIISKKS
tara:strand:- start:447 stop:1463 length:1017 start_codon:yes stop_codon:yes gene_type:complete